MLWCAYSWITGVDRGAPSLADPIRAMKNTLDVALKAIDQHLSLHRLIDPLMQIVASHSPLPDEVRKIVGVSERSVEETDDVAPAQALCGIPQLDQNVRIRCPATGCAFIDKRNVAYESVCFLDLVEYCGSAI